MMGKGPHSIHLHRSKTTNSKSKKCKLYWNKQTSHFCISFLHCNVFYLVSSAFALVPFVAKRTHFSFSLCCLSSAHATCECMKYCSGQFFSAMLCKGSSMLSLLNLLFLCFNADAVVREYRSLSSFTRSPSLQKKRVHIKKRKKKM